MDKIVRFQISFEGWSEANKAQPITSETGTIIGGFTVSEGPVWNCFVSRHGYIESLFLTDGVFATPIIGDHGAISEIKISIDSISEFSKKVYIQEE